MLLDAGGTLLSPAEPVAALYARIAQKHGHPCRTDVVGARFREAFRRARPVGQPRYVGDGRPYWRGIVSFAVGIDDPLLFEELYQAYAQPSAWTLAPGALEQIAAIRASGIKVAIASNWDNRLRPLLSAMNVQVDALAISSELAVEKPQRQFFHLATELVGAPPSQVVHVGDDPVDDLAGARAAGLRAWLWGREVRTINEVARRLGVADVAASHPADATSEE
jgi:REG-2-like HAD superfamily hydrolase